MSLTNDQITWFVIDFTVLLPLTIINGTDENSVSVGTIKKW